MRAFALGPILCWALLLTLLAVPASGTPLKAEVLIGDLNRPNIVPTLTATGSNWERPYYCSSLGLVSGPFNTSGIPSNTPEASSQPGAIGQGRLEDVETQTVNGLLKEHIFFNYIQRVRDKYSMLLVPDFESYLNSNIGLEENLEEVKPHGFSVSRLREFREIIHNTRRRLLTTLNVEKQIQNLEDNQFEKRLKECEDCYQSQVEFNGACADFKRNVSFFRRELVPGLYDYQVKQTLDSNEMIDWEYQQSRYSYLNYVKNIPVQISAQGYSGVSNSIVRAHIEVRSSVCHQPEEMLIHVQTSRNLSCTYNLRQVTSAMVDSCTQDRASILSQYMRDLSYECASYLFSPENQVLLQTMASEYLGHGNIDTPALD